MGKRILLIVLVMMAITVNAFAGDQVWRYVDEKSGKISYSNVPVKGQKGERVEIMVYPSPPRASPSNGGGPGITIPPEVLKKLQSLDGRGMKPSGLPPLPVLPGAKNDAQKPLVEDQAEKLANMDTREPSWAKEVVVAPNQQPLWAKDPFAQK